MSSALAGFFIVSEIYCLNGRPDFYKSSISWGVVELSNGFDFVSPTAEVARPRAKMAADTPKVIKVFLLTELIRPTMALTSTVTDIFPTSKFTFINLRRTYNIYSLVLYTYFTFI